MPLYVDACRLVHVNGAKKHKWVTISTESKMLGLAGEYRVPGRRYFAARADELLCVRSGCRQRSNAAKIIEDGLRLVRYEVDAGTPASTSRTASRESTRAS